MGNLNLRANIALGIIFAFLINTFGPLPMAQAQLASPAGGEFRLPAPGQMVALSPAFINLSPYEKDRIVPQEFGQTEMGRDLLAEDYLLKQITASLIYPESQLGKAFWQKIYTQAQAKYGTTNIPINTFNKVWIVPEKAVVYENKGTAFVLENHLKVMLEQDYLALSNSVSLRGSEATEAISKRTTNSVEIALPEERLATTPDFSIDPAQVRGVTFTIRQMTPVTNLPQILGLNQGPADRATSVYS